MRIFVYKTLREFWKRHADAENVLQAWHRDAESASWKSMSDIKARYATASVISAKRVVFNIGGNKYRLVASVDFEESSVYIRFIGTHKQYDRIDVRKV